MARFKEYDRTQGLFLTVNLEEQLLPGTFEWTLDYLIDKMDMSLFEKNYNNDETGAFIQCTSLTGITIPDGVTSIGTYAFLGCTNLTGITIPNSVTSIGWSAFEKCTNLTSVTFQGTIDSDNFGEVINWADVGPVFESPFDGDLREKFYATDKAKGTPGTYTTTAPVGENSVWTKQQEGAGNAAASEYRLFPNGIDAIAYGNNTFVAGSTSGKIAYLTGN